MSRSSFGLAPAPAPLVMLAIAATLCGCGDSLTDNTDPAARDDEFVLRPGLDVLSVIGDAGLLVNDADVDADALAAVPESLGSAQGGSVEIRADGGFTFTPRAGVWGWDSFTYTLEDEHGAVAQAAAAVLIRPSLAPLAAMAEGLGGVTIDGAAGGDHAGVGVAGGGDFDGDGLMDVVIGATRAGADAAHVGRVYIVYGGDTGRRTSLAATSRDAFVVVDVPRADAETGRALDVIGDFDGDGLDDIIIGVPLADDEGEDAGAAYIIYGRRGRSDISRAELEGDRGGTAITGFEPGEQAGMVVSAAGDVNGDGLADAIIGAPLADAEQGNDRGRSYIVLGGERSQSVDVGSSSRVTTLMGEDELDRAGVAVAEAGDFNGDGLADIVLGADGAGSEGRNNVGRAYVVFGASDLPSTIALRDLASNAAGITIEGDAVEDLLGGAVAGGGDFNGDGFADIAIGAIGVDASGSFAGRVYVVLGTPTPRSLTAAELASGQGGFVLDGEAADDRVGAAVALLADSNGDDLDELVIGSNASYSGADSGRTYVVFGREDAPAASLSGVVRGQGGFALEGERAHDFSGLAIDSAEDFNGDGLNDLILGARGNNNDNGGSAGRSYVVFGQPRFVTCPNAEQCIPDGDTAWCRATDDSKPSSGRSCM